MGVGPMPSNSTNALSSAVLHNTHLVSFDVFGTLIDVRNGSYEAFQKILDEAGGQLVDVKAFWEHWETENIRAYWRPYTKYREICRSSLAATFEHFGLEGDPATINHYFAAFSGFPLFPDVAPVLVELSERYPIALVSNIDDDLLASTNLPDVFGIKCTAEAARGYKPDGTSFRFLLSKAALPADQILHCGQSQYTDMVGGKPLGIPIAWINRRGVALDPVVPKPDFQFSDITPLHALVRP
jgi:2-haloacid dehalogenase